MVTTTLQPGEKEFVGSKSVMGNYYPLEDGFQNFVSLGAWEQFHVEKNNYRCLAQNLACIASSYSLHINISTHLDDLVGQRLGTSAAQSGLLLQDVKRFDGTRMAGMFDKSSVTAMHVLPCVEAVWQCSQCSNFFAGAYQPHYVAVPL